MPKSKRTKALAIPPEVKRAVLERDQWCVYCGRPGVPNAHFIARSHGGLGIAENVLTLCPECHDEYDHGWAADRQRMRGFFREYLQAKYPGWDESALTYKREGMT